MAETRRNAVITGIGMVSSLGEGPDTHWARLLEAKPTADSHSFAPYVVHRLAPLDLDKQIPKRGDQRQMEAWQRVGTYAAGLALDSAGVKGNPELLGRMDMIVAAGGGERDEVVDSAILSGLPKAANHATFLNEQLMNGLRPTLFLAQLSNLLAGNISIVHGVTGSSRTFMGEEAAGVDAIRIAVARIGAGQSDIALVGGGYNAERRDILLPFAFNGYLLQGGYRPIWERGPSGGVAPGSFGAFLVIEEAANATARGAKPIARITVVSSERSHRRHAGDITATLQTLWERLAPGVDPGHVAIVSGATGAEPATSEERAFLERHSEIPVRAPASFIGFGPEPQFVMNIAIAALVVSHGALYPPGDGSLAERPADKPVRQAVVTGVGHWRGEGIALVEAVN